MPEQHALLSASSSSRWLVCTPSARLESLYPNGSSAYAEEGTKAHALAEKTLSAFLKGGSGKVECEDGEMREAVQRYVDTCIEKITAAKTASPDAVCGVEIRLNFSSWVPKGFGTGDCVLVSDDGIEVIDLKYGKGVPVHAEGNTQMRLYALGAYARYGLLFDTDTITMTIVQPRLDSISSDTLAMDELLAWGSKIRPIAEKAFRGEGDCVAGGHCRFCRAKIKCKAHHDYLLDDLNFTIPDELTDDQLAGIVLKAKEIKSYISDVEAFALAEALKGKKWKGLKLVAGRSTRKITDEEKAIDLLKAGGYTDVYKPQELKTLTALEKLVGKKNLAELLKGVIEKPEGKPTLVPQSDRRKEIAVFDDKLIEEEN